MKEENSYFLQHELLGNLSLFDVLITYDYPRVFVCEDSFGCKYLFNEFISSESNDKWIVQRISLTRYIDLKTNKISLQKSYRIPEEKRYFIVDKNYEDDKFYVESTNILPAGTLTDYDTFVGQQESGEVDDHSILEKARKENSPIVDITLFPGEQGIDDIELSLFNRICYTFKKLMDSVLGKKETEKMRISTLRGSFVIRFNMNDPINVFNKFDSYTAIEQIRRVLNVSTMDDVLDIFEQNPNGVESYRNFIKVLKNANTPVHITSVSPNEVNINVNNLSVFDTQNRHAFLKNIYKEIISEIDITGTLIGGNFKNEKNPTFDFIDDFGKEYKGRINNHCAKKQFFTLKKRYKVKIKIISAIDRQSITKNEKYELLDIERLNY